ncbi:MAG: 4-oxalocrotonate decarboxylase [Rhodospirillaceae bacterium]|jgi:2-oxo-3-hexenedioate decarboxylase|nr:4-oxalocrotonate decarboxylase [Rhodospirillaceae bacterium]
MIDINQMARIVDEAARSAEAIPQLSNKYSYTLDEAYAIQSAAFQRRIARGEKQVGIKMGFTSRAKMLQMGLSDLVWGRLSDGMLIEDGGEISIKNYVHPRAEPELAFLLKRPLEGPVSAAEALAAVEAVAPAIEIIDSRYKNFKFSLEDVIADNSSSSGYLLGAWNDPDPDFSNLGMLLEVNGRPVQIGSSAAILGHPARSLAHAARLATQSGESLNKGSIVMAGGATAAYALNHGDYVRNVVQKLGHVSFSVAT